MNDMRRREPFDIVVIPDRDRNGVPVDDEGSGTGAHRLQPISRHGREKHGEQRAAKPAPGPCDQDPLVARERERLGHIARPSTCQRCSSMSIRFASSCVIRP